MVWAVTLGRARKPKRTSSLHYAVPRKRRHYRKMNSATSATGQLPTPNHRQQGPLGSATTDAPAAANRDRSTRLRRSDNTQTHLVPSCLLPLPPPPDNSTSTIPKLSLYNPRSL